MAGGLEKNILLLANHLVRSGRKVSLVTFDRPGAIAFYEIDPKINWYTVGKTNPHSPIGFLDRLRLIYDIRLVIKQNDRPIVVCFHHGLIPRFYLASLMLRLRLVCSERNSLSLYQHIRQGKWSLGFLALALTDRITVQFKSYVRDYPFWLKKRICIIHNPVHGAKIKAAPDVPDVNGRFRLLTVGRLCAQKNQKLLIDAFALQSQNYPRWDLSIVGDGDLYDELSDYINSKGLAKRVFLEGKQTDVPRWLIDSHLFCLPSRWEGFPNALAEAMSHGLPCVGLVECAGVRDLIEHEKNGLLTEGSRLAEALGKLMKSSERRKRMGRSAAELIACYAPENSFKNWDALLEQLDGIS
ncbi:glycosyltransferase [Mesorhizobium japonicum]|uniref:glycosyltransferase n=1 Tax=Mesorhizobium japonicum TaxID=2066070 RepID=UPI003B5C8991